MPILTICDTCRHRIPLVVGGNTTKAKDNTIVSRCAGCRDRYGNP